jgi:hypothetical protein
MCNYYYVYEWWRTDTNECFYVGKGCAYRAWSYQYRNHIFMDVISELTKKNMRPEVLIYKDKLGERQALKIEKERMAYWHGRFVTLSNVSRMHRRKVKQLLRRKARMKPTFQTLARVQKIFG